MAGIHRGCVGGVVDGAVGGVVVGGAMGEVVGRASGRAGVGPQRRRFRLAWLGFRLGCLAVVSRKASGHLW